MVRRSKEKKQLWIERRIQRAKKARAKYRENPQKVRARMRRLWRTNNPEKVRAHNEKAKQYQRLCRAKNLPYVVMSGSVCNEAEEAMSHKEGDRGYRA